MAHDPLPDLLARLDPHYARLLAEFRGTLAGMPQVPSRLASLCAIATAAGFEDASQLRAAFEGAGAAGVKPAEALEPIFYCMSFAGYRALAAGVATFVDVFGLDAMRGQRIEDYPDEPPIDGYDGPGLRVGIEMYGPIRARQNIDNFRAIGRDFADALERYAYTGVFRRRVLTAYEREFASVAMLSALEKPTPFAWHAKAALRLGAKPEQLRYAIVKQIPIAGVLRAFAAIRLLADVVADWRAHPGSDAV